MIKTLLQLAMVIITLAGIVIVASYFILLPKQSGDKTVNVSEKLFGWKIPAAEFSATRPTGPSDASSSLRVPGGIPRGLPVRLKIPAIGVNSAIEDALITPDGRMDIPAGSVNVAWFSLGPYPGKTGSAVIGGHFGIENGVPFVFYDLDKLKPGDNIYVEDDRGDTFTFVVRSTRSFDRNADATAVFTSSDGLAHLNLITCEGLWNRVNDSYPNRLVVFTDAVPSGAVMEKIQPAASSKPKLPEAAITNPVPAPLTAGNPNPLQTLFQQVTGLYATPAGGLITLLLLIPVIFIAFKIIRR